jgi:glycosyltransferase involved in cell wall biosynthesis
VIDKRLKQIQELNQRFAAVERKLVDEVQRLDLARQDVVGQLGLVAEARDALLADKQRLSQALAAKEDRLVELVAQLSERSANLVAQSDTLMDSRTKVVELDRQLAGQEIQHLRALAAAETAIHERDRRHATERAEADHAFAERTKAHARELSQVGLQLVEQSRRHTTALAALEREHIGRERSLAKQITELEVRAADLASQIALNRRDAAAALAEKKKLLDGREQAVTLLERTLQDRELELGRLSRDSAGLSAKLDQEKVQSAELSAHVGTLARSLDAAQTRLAELSESVDVAMRRSADLARELQIKRDEMERAVADFERTLAERTQQLGAASALVTNRDAEIAALCESLDAAKLAHAGLEQALQDEQARSRARSALERQLYAALESSVQAADFDLQSLKRSRVWRYSCWLRKCIGWAAREPGRLPDLDRLLRNAAGDRALALHESGQAPSPPTAQFQDNTHNEYLRMSQESIAELLLSHDEAFVHSLFRAFCKREADKDALKVYVGQMRRGVSKLRVFAQVAGSLEARRHVAAMPRLAQLLSRGTGFRASRSGGLLDIMTGRRIAAELDVCAALLRVPEDQFIDMAYQAILNRKPDRDGRNHYLNRLQLGHPRILILEQLRRSAEGRQAATDVPGLDVAITRFRLARLPVVGPLFRSLLGQEGDSAAERRLRIMERQLSEVGQQVKDSFERMKDSRSQSRAPELRMPVLDGAPQPERALRAPGAAPVFFTICSKNFTAYAKTLFQSVRQFHPDAETYLFLCDEIGPEYQTDSLLFTVVPLFELDIPDVQGMSTRYNITEFNTAIKPFAFAYLFKKLAKQRVVYVDPDILLVSPLHEVMHEFAQGADCILTPHLLQPAEDVEVSDGKMLLFGIYNLGFIGLHNSPNVVEIVDWWARRLEKECVIDLPNGLFVDQKWADLLPAYIVKTSVLHHPGYNVAYWNLSQRVVRQLEGVWYVNDQPLRFVHFSGNKLDDPAVFSRHSWSITMASVGELALLLNQYREKVYGHGHAEYSKLPYSFSWNGASGVNLHTPQPVSEPAARAAKVKRILYVDWAIPKPDRDAASVTACLLMRIFRSLNYEVVFLPCALQYEEGYFENLVADGIEVLCSPEVTSVEGWLEQHAAGFDIFFLARGPVVWPYVELLRRVAPHGKQIFNTVDLHYVREMRQATISGDRGALEAAEVTKRRELELVRGSDVTIVLSSEELYTVRSEVPEAALSVLPIVFEEMPGAGNAFSKRQDILFIGSFPHLPNVDAVLFFARSVMPIVWKTLPKMNFLVVGSKPPEEITALARDPRVEVLGFVEHLAPLFEGVRLSVAPLRYGAGIKGKIGSSLCYGVPCVATTMAIEGMGLTPGMDVLVGDSAEELAAAICKAYSDEQLWGKISAGGFDFARENYSVDVIAEKVDALLSSAGEGWRVMEGMYELANWDAWTKHRARMAPVHQQRLQHEQDVLPVDADKGFFTNGFCCVCGTESRFLTSMMYSCSEAPDGRPMPNWREHMQCQKCGLVNRMRAALHALHTISPPARDGRIYITEQMTSTFTWLHARYPKVQGSEYFGSDHAPGSMVDGVRNEDVMALSFADRSFDTVLSFDVLEHVPSPVDAFKEIYRVLDRNGVFIFSVPFAALSEKDVVRAVLNNDGSITHLLPPEIHGNPVDPEGGALCFRHFGWSMLEQLRQLGFRRVRALAYWSFTQGYLGGEQYLFIARKSD